MHQEIKKAMFNLERYLHSDVSRDVPQNNAIMTLVDLLAAGAAARDEAFFDLSRVDGRIRVRI